MQNHLFGENVYAFVKLYERYRCVVQSIFSLHLKTVIGYID